jgi:hypothetical protein
MDATQAPSVPQRGQIHAWIVNHDESKLFLVLYLTLALVLSVAIGLFWLVALVVVHFAFEHVRSRHEGLTGRAALGRALWNVKLDVALVLFALVLALYLQVVMGVLGLHAVSRAGALAQAGARGGIRFAAWEKVIRGILLSADDAVQGVRAFAAVRARRTGDAPSRAAEPEPAPRLTRGDRFTLGLAAVCTVLILASPWMGHESWQAVVGTLAAELHPFPFR